MNIVFVCAEHFQDYILTNIQQHLDIRSSNSTMYVLTNGQFFSHFDQFKNQITLINIDELTDTYEYLSKTTQDKQFRDGFWALTSMRFFYIYAFMDKYNVDNIIHLENDVMVYYDYSVLQDKLTNHMYLPFDTFQRNIASIVYIPNIAILKSILDKYDYSNNDMENFAQILNSTDLIRTFPICRPNNTSDQHRFVTENFDQFNYIFDAAAIGQYLGGVDPRNKAGDTKGFVNETCVIKYDKYVFTWNIEEGTKQLSRPFVTIDNVQYPIFNLHIHSKELKNFLSKKEVEIQSSLFDIIIPLGPNEKNRLQLHVDYIIKNVIGYRNIYVVTFDTSIQALGCIIIDENIFPFNKTDIENIHGKSSRNGWYLQQLLKIYSGKVIPGILDRYLVIDSDTYFVRPTQFINDQNKCLYSTRSEYYIPYFEHMKRLHPSLEKMKEQSGIAHHMMFEQRFLEELFRLVEKYHGNTTPFWEIFLKEVDKNEIIRSGASEYEIYFNFMIKYHPDEIQIRVLSHENLGKYSSFYNYKDTDYVSFHHWNN